MTHKISEIAAKNFHNCKKWKQNNTKVEVFNTEISLRLFGNEIAFKKTAEPNRIFINFKGWRTRTTVDRLEALTELSFSIANGSLKYRQYSNKDWIEIESFKWYELKKEGVKTWLELSK